MFTKVRISFLFILNSFSVIFYLIHSGMPPLELTNQTLITGIFWNSILLIPVLIPLFFDNIVIRWIVFLFGILITLSNCVLAVGYLLDAQLNFGILVLVWSFNGIIATVLSYKWIKMK